jgi:tetratricopeptide (TPR) repeat protein
MLQLNNSSGIMEPDRLSKSKPTHKRFTYKLLFLLICLHLPILPMFGQVRTITEIEQDYQASSKEKDYGKMLSLCKEYLDSWNIRHASQFETLVEGTGQNMYSGRNAIKFKDKLYYVGTGIKSANEGDMKNFVLIGIRMANAYLRKNDTIAALEHLNDILNTTSYADKNGKTAFHITRYASNLFMIRGRIYSLQGEFEKAVKDYEIVYTGWRDMNWKMLDHEKKDILPKDILKNYYLKNNKYEDASRILRLWLNEESGANMSADDYAMLGFTYYKKNDMANAVKYYNEATKLEPQIDIDSGAADAIVAYLSELETQKKEKERQLKEAETKRIAAIKSAQIGDKILYSEKWDWTEPGLLFSVRRGTSTMYVMCFIERIEGDRYQLRVGDVVSSDSEHYNTPVINGVRISKGDIIWAKPLTDNKWIYGE